MASLVIRRIDEQLKAKLRVQAARKGRSMEEEARTILAVALAGPSPAFRNAADAVRSIIDPVGGIELDLPPRSPMRELPRFDWDDEERGA
jgi:antitoxin FitA